MILLKSWEYPFAAVPQNDPLENLGKLFGLNFGNLSKFLITGVFSALAKGC